LFIRLLFIYLPYLNPDPAVVPKATTKCAALVGGIPATPTKKSLAGMFHSSFSLSLLFCSVLQKSG